MTNSRIQPWRWAVKTAQALLVLGLPFVMVNGESVLRFDVPTLTLHFFGSRIWMDEFFLVLVALLFVSFLFILLTMLLGRVWCGWLCPQTVIIDFTRFLDRAPVKGLPYRVTSFATMLILSVPLAASILWYFVSPYAFFAQLASGTLGPVTAWSWAVLSVVTFLNFAFVRHTFCTTICPYARMQGALFDDRTLVIASDPARMDECMHCDACVTTCPVGIDVRQGLSAACMNCAECIDACARQMGRRQRRSLIGYRFGTSGGSGRLLRRNTLLAGAATAAFLLFFLVLAFSRSPFDLDIAADPSTPPRFAEDGALVNAYTLSISNRSGRNQEIIISAAGTGGPLVIQPEQIGLGEGEHKRVQVLVRSPRGTAGPLELSARLRSDQQAEMKKNTMLQVPW